MRRRHSRTRKRLVIVAAVLAIGVGSAAQARERVSTRAQNTLGLGLMLGSPSGLSAKYYLGDTMALQGGLGVVRGFGSGGIHLNADFLWHPTVLHRAPAFSLPWYFGVGARYLRHDYSSDPCFDGRSYYGCSDGDSHIGARVPVGLLMDFKRIPLDVFLELALVVDFIYVRNDRAYRHEHGFGDFNGTVGARYYF